MFNFSEHMKVSDEWISQPFYSERDGYKLYLRVGAGGGYDSYKGTHVSVSVGLMKGEYDENLEWPFNSEITIQLLNWRDNKGHVEKIIGHYNAPIESRTRVIDGERADPLGKHKFISSADLGYNVNKNTQYLQNNTLCFGVSKVTIHKGIITIKLKTFMYTYRVFV